MNGGFKQGFGSGPGGPNGGPPGQDLLGIVLALLAAVLGTPYLFEFVGPAIRKLVMNAYMNIPKWGIAMRPGKHEPLISFEVWKQVQERLDGNAHAPARKDIREDFPLRGFVCCDACGSPMTAGWSKGRNTHYPYYNCQNRRCVMRGKSVRKERIEGDFETLLKSLKPSRQLFAMVTEMFKDAWRQQAGSIEQAAAEARREIGSIETKIDALVGRIVEAKTPAVIEAYERQIASLDGRRIELKEIVVNAKPPQGRFEDLYRTTLTFLSNPWKLWASGRLDMQRLVLRLAFVDRPRYCRNEGYRTAPIAEPLRLLASVTPSMKGMVGVQGLEPWTR